MLLAVLLVVPACKRNEPQSTQAASEDRATTERMKNERDDYVKTTEDRLAKLDQKVDGLDKRSVAMSGATKADFNAAIDRLRDQRKDVSSKLDDLKAVSIESWPAMKSTVDSAMADLDRSYQQVSETYEKGT